MLVNIKMTRAKLNQELSSLNQESGNVLKQNLADFFDYMLNVSREGIHRVFMERDLMLWVYENIELHNKERSQLRQIWANCTQLGSKVESIPCSMTVTFAQNEFIKREGYNWGVSYLNFVNGLRFSRIELLVENEIYDGDFYSHIFQTVANNEKYDVGLLNFNPHHCGGKQFMIKLLPRYVNPKTMALCIGDRDTSHPSDDCADELIKKYHEIVRDDFFGFVTITVGRAAENHLTLEILELMYPKKDTSKLKNLINNQEFTVKGDSLWLYYDIKEGVNPKKILENCEFDDKKAWIRQQYQIDQFNAKDENLPRFGNKVLEHFLKNPKAQQEFSEFINTDYWEDHFHEWVEPILWYLCGEIPQK